MFTATALGHQGWLIGGSSTHVLVDPVLTSRFTRMPISAPSVFPPRKIDLSGFPPIDAVLITHEHPDHLDFASLQLLDRATPVYLSAHSSDAAKSVIASIGLQVCTLEPGVATFIGDLLVLPFAPPRVGEAGSNEIDVVPLLIRDRDGHGSFFTSVDLPARSEWADEVRRHIDRPGVWADANSSYDRSLHFEWVSRVADPVGEAARLMAQRYASLFDGWGHPEIVMVTDNGLTLGADLSSLNAHVFEVANDHLVAAVGALLPGHVFRAALPGTTAELVNGTLVQVRSSQPFLAPDDVDRWPVRGGAPVGPDERLGFSPGTGRRTLGAADRARLENALCALGRFLFGRGTFCGLYQLMANRDHATAVLPTVALVLRDGERGDPQVWEYRPRSSTFARVACEDPTKRYIAGAEFWAADLLAVLSFQAFADDLFHFGRKRVWNSAPTLFRCDLDTEIELYAHALRFPDAIASLYRSCLDREAHPQLRGPAPPSIAAWPAPPARAPVARPVSAAFAPSLGASPAPRGASAAPRPPSAEDLTRLADAVAVSGGGAWTISSAVVAGRVLRLTLSALDQTSMTLDVAPADETARYYRRLGDLAFSYGPGSVDKNRLSILEKLIVAVASALGGSTTTQRRSHEEGQ